MTLMFTAPHLSAEQHFLVRNGANRRINYGERVPEPKMLFCAKTGLQKQTCFALGKRGVLL